MTLLAVSQLLLMGARLGAIQDVVPAERFEPDPGPDPDVDPLRQGLANLFDGLDEYADVVDPLTSTSSSPRGSLSNDLAEIAGGPRRTACGTTTTGRRRRGAVVVAVLATCRPGAIRRPRALRVLQSLLATSGSTPTRTPSPTPSSTPCTPEGSATPEGSVLVGGQHRVAPAR